jgi:hypothetical protein
MKLLLAAALRLYPASWRRRYGRELEALIEDSTSVRWVDISDLATAALSERMHDLARRASASSHGGFRTMLEQPSRRPRTFALAAVAVLAPSACLVALAILKYVIGWAAPFDAIEPAAMRLIANPVGNIALALAPYVALLLAVVPVVRAHLGWTEGHLAGHVELSVPVANAVAAVLSLALIFVMALYWLAENL